VRAGEVVCALPLAAVRRVVRALPVYPLPGAAPGVAGLAEFAGEPLAVLDLVRLLEAPLGGTPAFPVTVIVWAGPAGRRELVGLAVDEALELVPLPAPAGEAATTAGGALVAGEAEALGRPVRLLDPSALGVRP
jgi:chemotaxis signal transduction protein